MSYRSVYCIAASHVKARRAVQRLGEIDFPTADTSVFFLETAEVGIKTKLRSKNARAGSQASRANIILGKEAVTQTLAIPAVGSLVAIGPVTEVLGAVASYGIAGGLREFGVPSVEASRYELRIKEGGVFLSIRTENPDKSDRAREIFAAEGAEEIRTLMAVFTPKLSRRSQHGRTGVLVG